MVNADVRCLTLTWSGWSTGSPTMRALITLALRCRRWHYARLSADIARDGRDRAVRGLTLW